MSEGSEVNDRLAALEAVIAEQAACIAELQRTISRQTGGALPSPDGVPPASAEVGRRQLLSSVGKVAAGAMAGSAVVIASSASPAAAATFLGDATGSTPGITGNTAVSTAPGVKATSNQAGSSSPALQAENTAANGTAIAASATGSGGFAVLGNAVNNGRGIVGFGLTGVRGETNLVNGIGVDGSSIGSNGIGVRGIGTLSGVKGESEVTFGVGVSGSSSGVSGVGVLGDGGTGLNNIGVRGAGPTGVRGESNAGTGNGVVGVSNGNGFAGVRGQSTGGGVSNALTSGVFGTSNGGDGFGVSGQGAGGGGTGVYGVGTKFGARARAVAPASIVPPPFADAAGLVAEGVGVLGGVPAAGVRATSSAGVGAQVSGAAANLHLVAGPAGPARDHTFGHAVGELALASDGTLWVCVTAGAPGQPGAWKRVAFVEDLPPGFDPGTLSGVFSAPAKPGRVYDSRNRDGKLSGGQSRTISVAKTLPTPSEPSVEIVPAGASAAVFTLTLDQTEGSGFLAVFPSNVAFPGTSSINWFTSGQILANGGTVTLPADRTVTVLAGGSGATHFILDITGVYT